MSDTRTTVLVTGGCGFLGSHIVDAFVRTGRYRVVAVSRNPTRYCNPGAEYIACDASNQQQIGSIIQEIEPQVIVHTITPGPFAPASKHHTDVSSTKNLINTATESQSVRAFVYSGSVEGIANALGARRQPLREDEADLHSIKTAPSPYALGKGLSADAVIKANGQGLCTAVLHLPGMYGPRDGDISPGILKMAKTPMTRVQLGNNEVVHDWLYVENAALAHLLAAETLLRPNETAGRVDGEGFFVTDGAPMKFWDFTRKMWASAGVGDCDKPGLIIPWWCVVAMAISCEVIFLVFTLGQIPAPLTRLHVHYMKEGAWFDISKAKMRLGYVPKVSTEDGIQQTASWFQQTSIAAQHKKR